MIASGQRPVFLKQPKADMVQSKSKIIFVSWSDFCLRSYLPLIADSISFDSYCKFECNRVQFIGWEHDLNWAVPTTGLGFNSPPRTAGFECMFTPLSWGSGSYVEDYHIMRSWEGSIEKSSWEKARFRHVGADYSIQTSHPDLTLSRLSLFSPVTRQSVVV